MKAVDRLFQQIINGNTQFVIPVFQRDYRWSEAQCEQLWKDIVRVGTPLEEHRHFMGSLVYVPTQDNFAGFTRWLLIDGQQRMTTLTLLTIALRDHLARTGWAGGEDAPTRGRLETYFLVNHLEEGARRHKLVLRNHDQTALAALLDGQRLPEGASTAIRDNYELFLEKLQGADPQVVYRGVTRLVVVDVLLDRVSDDPQLVFESLNSTGLDLSPTDLIRNYLLMRLPEAEQTRLYTSYWHPLEELFRGAEWVFNDFIRDFLALENKASRQEPVDNLYFAFRETFSSRLGDSGRLTELLQRLCVAAVHYAAFRLDRQVPPELREALARLRPLADVPALLVMRLMGLHEERPNFSLDQLRQALGLLESYLFRRAVCGWQTRGYWNVFSRLAYRIDPQQPLESLKAHISLLHESNRFPSDQEFEAALVGQDLYYRRICRTLLERLENDGFKERTDTSTYTVEHVMPQNPKLPPAWRDMLGSDWEALQRTWLHRLGNLTLTGYNASYSDRSFQEKKSMAGGFHESAVHLNGWIREQTAWTPVQMEARGHMLAKRALILWPGLVVSQELRDQVEREEKRDLSQRKRIDQIAMSAHALSLFQALRERLAEIDSEIIALVESHSVSFHAPGYFLEVIPRKYGLTWLLDLDYNDVDHADTTLEDARAYKFVIHASRGGGVLVKVWTVEQVDRLMPLVLQAMRADGHA